MKNLIYKFVNQRISKLFIIILANVLISPTLWAQSPEKMSYQSVIRNSSDALVTNTQIGMQISILQGADDGAAIYTETQTPTTNANGLVSIEIGGGAGFSSIDWANGPYFIKTETDPTGGSNYTINGTSQLLSVPYALHANEVDPSVPQGTQTGEMQYWNGSEWVIVATTENEGATLQMIGGVPTWTGGTSNVTNPTTGKIWMDRNLGASQVATSSTDADAYGDLYQWGRTADGHESRTSGLTSTLATSDTPGHSNFITNSSSPYDWRNPQNDNLWQGISGTNNPCPSGYRLPTEAEWNAERTSWSTNNAAGAFASPLKLSVAGSRYFSDGSLGSVGSYGNYWSSAVVGTYARYLSFSSSLADMGINTRAYGYSVRCLKD